MRAWDAQRGGLGRRWCPVITGLPAGASRARCLSASTDTVTLARRSLFWALLSHEGLVFLHVLHPEKPPWWGGFGAQTPPLLSWLPLGGLGLPLS